MTQPVPSQEIETVAVPLNIRPHHANCKFAKPLMFTDIHFGAKNNSAIQNQDCLDFINLIVLRVKSDPSIDCIIFLGDWHENRNAINILTLNASAKALQVLNSLGIPVLFLIGNHDLYFRNTREVNSLPFIDSLANVYTIDQITSVDQADVPFIVVPFLFPQEYPGLTSLVAQYKVWMGHFEFKDFVLTGYTTKLEHGPDHNMFKGLTKLFSGHFHKRQQMSFVHYIGNTHGTTYGDVGDPNRGYAIYDMINDDVEYVDWTDGPTYHYTSLSKLTADFVPVSKGYYTCVADQDISPDARVALRDKMLSLGAREFKIDENTAIVLDDELENVEVADANINDIVIELLGTVNSKGIDNSMLISMYVDLK